jgi:two-component system phosphate regulon sensor histidine kinase PhoR
MEFRLAKSRQKQEETSKRLLSLTTSFGNALMMIDEDGICQLANKEFIDYFHIDMNQRDYKNLLDIKGLFKFVNSSYLLEQSLREQISYNNRVYDLISTPLFENNLYQGCFILASDITIIKNAEKYQKQFTADVSHELRTPLSAIKGFSEILSRDEEIDKEQQIEFTNLIHKEAERMEYILNDLMIISKMDRIDYELDMTPHDIHFIVDECVSVLRNQISKKQLDLSVVVESKVLNVDKHKLSQVILNLLKNAINYTDYGFIKVKGKQEDNFYVLSIEDSGIGIEEKHIERIFKRFYRIDKARSRDSGGSGLGLSICKNVIMKHNGEISVHSEVGKGSTFKVKLPI